MDLTLYLGPKIVYCLMILMALTTKLAKKTGSALINLLDMDVLAQFKRASSPRDSTVTASLSSMYLHAYLAADLNPEIMLVGCTFILMS